MADRHTIPGKQLHQTGSASELEELLEECEIGVLEEDGAAALAFKDNENNLHICGMIPTVEVEAGENVAVKNNALNILTGDIPAAMVLEATSGEGIAANFMVQCTPAVDCTLTVLVNGESTLYVKAAGNVMRAGKTYQISCLNNCWTMAAFEA